MLSGEENETGATNDGILKYSRLPLRRTALGPALAVRLREMFL